MGTNGFRNIDSNTRIKPFRNLEGKTYLESILHDFLWFLKKYFLRREGLLNISCGATKNRNFPWQDYLLRNKNVLHTAEFDARAAMVNSLSFNNCCSLSSPRAAVFAIKID